MAPSQVFLLSPARCDGRRAAMLLRPEATSPAADRLRAGTLTLGDAFTFMSALYFRGKLTYAQAFSEADPLGPTSYIITPTRGLQTPDSLVSISLLQELAILRSSVGLTCRRRGLSPQLSAWRASSTCSTAAAVSRRADGSPLRSRHIHVLRTCYCAPGQFRPAAWPVNSPRC